MFKWLWNPASAWAVSWNVSSWVTIFQLAAVRELFPGFYEGTMNFIAPVAKPAAMFLVSAWGVSKEVIVTFWNTS